MSSCERECKSLCPGVSDASKDSKKHGDGPRFHEALRGFRGADLAAIISYLGSAWLFAHTHREVSLLGARGPRDT